MYRALWSVIVAILVNVIVSLGKEDQEYLREHTVGWEAFKERILAFPPSKAAEITDAFGSPNEIGRLFLTDQLLAFELISVVLLVAAVGGVILGSHSKAEDQDARA